MRTVLVPIDGSECSLPALHYLAGARGEDRGATLHLLNVRPAMTDDGRQSVARADLDHYRGTQSDEAKHQARDVLDSAGIVCKSRPAVGHADDCITRCAGEPDCDHIVLGTHGRPALATLLVGSATLGVLHQTRVPVVLVK